MSLHIRDLKPVSAGLVMFTSATLRGELRRQLWMRCLARKPATCSLTQKPIPPGVALYRPMTKARDFSMRILASEIDRRLAAAGATPAPRP